MTVRNRSGMKQMNFDIPEAWHKDIKMRALLQNMSIKDWILLAMGERIKKEKELE